VEWTPGGRSVRTFGVCAPVPLTANVGPRTSERFVRKAWSRTVNSANKTNRKRLGWIILLVAVGTTCAVLGSCNAAHEPLHQGRALHAWIADIDQVTFRITSTNGITLQQTNAAAAAIMATADQAIPWLRSELRCRDSSLRPHLRKLALVLPQKLGGAWVAGAVARSGSNRTDWVRHRQAAMAALIIGYKSRALAPDLTQLLNSGDRCWLYTYALARMGEDGVPCLAWALTNRNEQIRKDAVEAMRSTTSKLDLAVPAFLYAITNLNRPPSVEQITIVEQVREILTGTQGGSAAVSAFVEAASHDTNQAVQQIASETLRAFTTRNSLYANKQGYLQTDIYGNGKYEF
jgi:hypothetical protein